MQPGGKVLLTGATGFVGRYLYPALAAAGYEVRCASRDPARAARDLPGREWVRLDLEEPATLEPALAGCEAAFFLVHGLGGGGDYPGRERAGAERFRDAAARVRLGRVVYLGGVAPTGGGSRHLQSRLDVGRVLREGAAPTVELRAAMIVGHGSASWQVVRDLAARLPAMVLPRWLQNHSRPVAIEDVVAALLSGLQLAPDLAGWYEVPGPERVSHRETLERAAALLGVLGARPVMLDVPVLTPRLSSYWIALVTRVDLALAQELVEGLRYDLDPSGPALWDVAPGYPTTPLEEAMRRAIDDERTGLPGPTPAAVARLERIGRTVAAPARAA